MKYFIALLLSLAFLTVVLFREIPSLYFFSDDFVWLLTAKHDSVIDIPNYIISAHGFFYRPTTKTYFLFMWQLFHDRAWAYHLVNIFFHILTSIGVYLLSLKLMRRLNLKSDASPFLTSFFSSLVYFVHPVHLENIIWPSAITELIPAFCTIFGLYFFISSYSTFTRAYRLAVLVLFGIGLGAHEYMVVFPLLVYLTDWYWSALRNENSRKGSSFGFPRFSRFYFGLCLVDLLYIVLRAIADAHWSGGDYSYNLWRLPFNAAGNVLGYIGLLFVGIPFIEWYSQVRLFMRTHIELAIVIFVSGILLCLLLVRKIAQYKKLINSPFIIWSGLFFLITMLPFLGLGGIAERYLYLSSFPLILIVSYLIALLAQKIACYTDSVAQETAFSLIIGVGLVFYAMSILQNQSDWLLASQYVDSQLVEFRNACDSFSDNQTLVRTSPPNRLGRAWVFQVGYEEGANLYCDKNLHILRK